MIIRPALFENPESEPGALADVAFGSKASLRSTGIFKTWRHVSNVPAEGIAVI
jgi:hypothetical protein